MSDKEVQSIAPRGIVDFRVFIVPASGAGMEITDIVSELSIYESIFSPVLYGDVLLIDSIEAYSSLPIRGQEELTIHWERDEETIVKTFNIVSVFDINTTNNTIGTYGLSFVAKNQLVNATSLFSKFYKGKISEIIEEIYEEFMGNDPEIMKLSDGKKEINVVFPFMKPFQAINMLIKKSLADDNSPMFFFETLYGEHVVMASLKELYNQDSLEVTQSDDRRMKSFTAMSSETTDGKSTNEWNKHRGQVYEQNFPSAYDMLEQVKSGSFTSYSTTVDISQKKFKEEDFDFKAHAPSVAIDPVDSSFSYAFEKDTKNFVLRQNKLAFENTLPNLCDTDERDYLKLQSYMKRLTNTVNLKIHMDSVSFFLNKGWYVGAGQVLEFDLSKFFPRALADDEPLDKPNSGKYLISSLRHYIKRDDYTMSVELIRDGLGDE